MSDDQRGALLSECGLYRWRLWRRWSDGPLMVFCMLNPSTADAEIDDPTIRRCMSFARREGLAGISVVNLFPWRATDPKDLTIAAAEHKPVRMRRERDQHIRAALVDAKGRPPVAAWGSHRLAQREAPFVLPLAADWHCLGRTKDGSPRHPLYLRADAPFEVLGE